ncbi:MAG: Small GTP-binding domain protein [Promethearchaeota archaeon]|jgi:small GTP-binding protein|nr:MAG: Small GTP-binding domain protein [Candidatus Lokiarchaeota archaeon]
MIEEQKIIVLGLDNAGKTSLLSRFGGKLGIDDLASLEPTRGVDRREIDTKDMNFLIWDFGGQKDHRDQYLEEPERYFQDIDLIIYVFDIQDIDRIEESLNYFNKILELVIKLEENPYFLIFLHKYDPEIQDNKSIKSNIKNIKDQIEPELNERKYNYEIYLTSIYSSFPNQPKFVNLVREIINGKTFKKGPIEIKIERMAQILESTINAVIQLSSRIINLEKKIKEKTSKPSVKKLEKIPTGTPGNLEKLKEKTIKNLNDVIVEEDQD